MSQLAPIFNALRLPISDVDALIQGRTIAAMPQTFLRPGQQFGLYADESNLDSGNVLLKAWARCELCQPIDSSEALIIISGLTGWSVDTLQAILVQRGSLWLAYLRVYLFPSPVEVPIKTTGQFIPLTNPITVTDDLPVVSDRDFARLKQQLENLEPPEPLDVQIQRMLKEDELQRKMELSKELNWIETINDLGTATTGGNYEKGTAFEQIVQRSLTFLGFELDPSAKGGAGGMDLCCIKPYLLVGECKSGLSIPGNTVYELHKLGNVHLTRDIFDSAVKLIIGPGKPTDQLKKSSQEYKISIINPMTLQKLVELNARYSGSVNLIELKGYLEAGQIDSKIDEYIEKVMKEIKLRSHIIQSVKELMNQPGEDYLNASAVRVQYNAIFGKDANSRLDDRATHELLVELSSPLTGYLGREKSNSNWRGDRFYFLRDLPIEKET